MGVLVELLVGSVKLPLLPQPDNCVVILINARPPIMTIKAQFTQQVPFNVLIKFFISFELYRYFKDCSNKVTENL